MTPARDGLRVPRWRRRLSGRLGWALGAIAALALAVGGATAGMLFFARGDASPGPLPLPFEVEDDGPPFDVAGFEPFAYEPDDEEDLLERATAGFAHVVYAKSPGGVEATAERVNRFQPLIDEAAERHGVDPETLGALVFLESAGRPEVMAAGDPENATGLAQILPGTAVDLLGMSVDLEESEELTSRIERNAKKGRRADTRKGERLFAKRVERLRRRRARVDERFDPEASLDGAARYLALAEERFGREDLAIASYHMGIGNLEDVIEAYVAPRRPRRTTRATVAAHDLSYLRLYFDSSPHRNPRTHRKLRAFGDDSRHYLFRLEAAREIRRLHEEDRDELRHAAAVQTAKASAEEVLRPEEDNPPFEDADELRDAYEDGELVALANEAGRLGYRIGRDMGELARRLDEPRALYRGLRPEALATLLYIAKETRRIAGHGALRVTSTVRDRDYQELLVRRNGQATREFSLHTTGYAIDVARDFRSERQADALVHVLERLRALNVIDWVYEPGAIHLTVGPDGERFMPLYEAVTE